jgi:hypothetical protein
MGTRPTPGPPVAGSTLLLLLLPRRPPGAVSGIGAGTAASRRFAMMRVSCWSETVLPVPGPARTKTPCASCVPCERKGDGARRCSARASMLSMEDHEPVLCCASTVMYTSCAHSVREDEKGISRKKG